jgi:hypothetical protein
MGVQRSGPADSILGPTMLCRCRSIQPTVLDVGAEGRKQETKGSAEEKTPEQILPVNLAKGQLQDIVDIEARKKKTRPPKRFTEGTPLTAMQTAGQSLDDGLFAQICNNRGRAWGKAYNGEVCLKQ